MWMISDVSVDMEEVRCWLQWIHLCSGAQSNGWNLYLCSSFMQNVYLLHPFLPTKNTWFYYNTFSPRRSWKTCSSNNSRRCLLIRWTSTRTQWYGYLNRLFIFSQNHLALESSVDWITLMSLIYLFFLQMKIFDKNKDGRLDLNDLARYLIDV